MNTIWIVLPILTLLMFELGLNLEFEDFKLFKYRPKPVIAGLIGQIIILPALAWLIGWALKLEPIFLIGFVLIACCPGGSSSNVFSMIAKGDVALSVSLTACSSIITLFTVPLIMDWVTASAGSQVNVHLPVGKLVMQNIVLMFLPIAVGIAVRKRSYWMANKIHKVLSKIAFPALIFLATVFFIQNREAIIDKFGQLGLSITVLILLAMASGVALSWAMRVNTRERRTIVIEIGMQNAAQAIAIASSPLVFNNDLIAIPAIIYALMMNIILIIYVAVVKNR
ncbi:MAG: bile acid:sodium symporter family protein [Muribaculaceae bacterium]|nr:bile acid:sodium symporter family protein [Muribaculaceae bacterium]MBR0024539.1 bile acid:sodium symporter family protein [Muribaculaceae bacterium]